MQPLRLLVGTYPFTKGFCGNEHIRLMARWEYRMDELAAERLLQTVKDDAPE